MTAEDLLAQLGDKPRLSLIDLLVLKNRAIGHQTAQIKHDDLDAMIHELLTARVAAERRRTRAKIRLARKEMEG